MTVKQKINQLTQSKKWTVAQRYVGTSKSRTILGWLFTNNETGDQYFMGLIGSQQGSPATIQQTCMDCGYTNDPEYWEGNSQLCSGCLEARYHDY